MFSAGQIVVYFVIGLVVTRYLVGALHDIQISFAQLKFLKHVKARISKRVPRITIVFFGQCEPNKIAKKLHQDLANIKKLKNVNLLLLDNASKNGSLAVIRNIAKENKSLLKVVTVKKQLNSREQVLKRVKKAAQGSIVVVLPMQATISAHSIIRLQQLYSAQPKLNLLNLQELRNAPRSNQSVFKIFTKISNRRYSSPLHNSDQSCIAVRKRCITGKGELKDIQKNIVSSQKYPIYYTISDIDFMYYNKQMSYVRFVPFSVARTFSTKVYDLWAAGSFLAESFVYVYALYLAMTQNVYEPLIIGYALVTGCYVYALMLQDGYGLLNKTALVVYVPVLFLQEIIYNILIKPLQGLVQLFVNLKYKRLVLG